MNALVFLGIAALLSLVGCLVLWARSRQPRSMDAHIRDFARELDALAPGSTLDRYGRRPARRDHMEGGSSRHGPERPAGSQGTAPPEHSVGWAARSPRPAEPRPGPEPPVERAPRPPRPLEQHPGPEWPPERPPERPGAERPPERGRRPGSG